MQILKSYSAFMLLFSLVLTSCQTGAVVMDGNREVYPSYADDLTRLLETDSSLYLKESPFLQREFRPYVGDEWIGGAISYGCYRRGQAPGVKGPSEDEILEDLRILLPYWKLIRVYGSDEDSERVLQVIHDNHLPIRVMLGIWLENETRRPERERENVAQITKGIELANRFPDEVLAINVGNETQVDWSWHRMEMRNLIRYIRLVRKMTSIPITTADDYNFWNKSESKIVAEEIDFIGLHAYPLWNGVTLEASLPWLDSLYYGAQALHPDKMIIVSETGWATVYNPEKKGPGEEGTLVKAEVSLRAQEIYLRQLNAWSLEHKITTFVFEAFDEPWKGGGDQSDPSVMEKHWGLFYENRSPKGSFINVLK